MYFHVLSTEFQNFDPFSQKWPEFGGGGIRGADFSAFGEILWPKGQKKCHKMYFDELQMTEHDTKSVPEGENKWFCHTRLLIGIQEPVDLRRSLWTRAKKDHSKLEVMLTKILVFCHYGGPNWYFCNSWACCKTCVRVTYASFDPPLEIVSLGGIFQNL